MSQRLDFRKLMSGQWERSAYIEFILNMVLAETTLLSGKEKSFKFTSKLSRLELKFIFLNMLQAPVLQSPH